CWVLGALVALSRVVLGVHWTSDVVAGWALGAGVALVSVSVLVVTARGASGSVLEGEPGNFRRVESEDLSEERQLGLERDDL
ncbi:MAG TPA: phosphatase PAP2 family protein, partial [Actinomycetes bacterium]|nr:phosphatase PAP2 family protein [Actinomycetes bacterium]